MFTNKITHVFQVSLIAATAAFIILSFLMIGIPGTKANDNINDAKIKLQDNIISTSSGVQPTYTGMGAPLGLQEWANSKNVTPSRSLIGAGTTGSDIQLAAGWTGYKMYTNLYNLYDTVEWAQATGMVYDGSSNNVNNGVWTFVANSGNYPATGRDGSSSGANYCYVNLNPHWSNYPYPGYSNFYTYQNGWWQQIFSLPRGTIVGMWVAYSYQLQQNGSYPFVDLASIQSYLSVNGTEVYTLNAIQMGADNQTQGPWMNVAPQAVPLSVINSLNAASGGASCHINFSIGLQSTQNIGFNPESSAIIYFHNCRIFIEALAQPTQAGLQIAFTGVGGNGGAKNAIQNVGSTYGTGQLNFSATPSPWVALAGTNLDIVSTITTSETVHYPGDNLEIVQFNMYQVMYGSHFRNTQISPSALAANGTMFIVANNSNVNWTTYFYDRPPQITGNQQDYANYMFNGTKPADWTVYSVLDSEPLNTTANLIGRTNGSTFITMPKSAAGFYGYWTISARSRNYVQSISVPSTIYQGKPLRINGTIISTNMTNKYISSTKAMLTILFPNGTIWTSASRTALAINRQIAFPAITIPTTGVNYVAGTYTAILSWNNTRSGLPLNESGYAARTFTVLHNATLIPQYSIYWNNLNTQTALPIQLRYVDTSGSDISDALITFMNFDSKGQNFTHVNGYYNYLTFLNCTKGASGLRSIVITATSPEFQPVVLTLQVEIVRASSFTIDQYPSVTAQWNDNFSLVLHYNDSVNHNPIGIKNKNNITVTWPQEVGKFWVNMAQNNSGKFTLLFNTTGTLPNTIYTVPISIKQAGFQNQTIIMTISITTRMTSLNLVQIPDLAFGSLLNVSGTFKEISSGNLIANTTGKIRTFAWIISGPNCTVTIGTNGALQFTLNSALLADLGKYTIRVDVKWRGQPYYTNLTSTLSFNLVQRSSQAYASSTFDTKYWGSNFTIPITYVDVINGSAISGSNVHITIRATYQGTSLTAVNTKTQISYGSGTWNLNFNATQFGHPSMIPGFNIVISVNWTRNKAPYYVNQTVSFTITISQAPTFIYIVDPSKQTVPSGYNNTITFNLINQQSGKGINGMQGNITVKSLVLPNNAIFNPLWSITWPRNNGSYVLTFNITSASSENVAFNLSISMSFYASIANYSFTLIKIAPVPLIELVNVDQVYLGQRMNITVFYHLQGVTSGIPNAKITMQDGPKSGNWTGTGDFTYKYDGTSNYNITFTPSFTNRHVNKTGSYSVFINCSSSKGNSQLRVNYVINPIPDAISAVYFNNVNYTTLPTYNAYIGDIVHLRVSFKNINGSAIPGASVHLTLGAFSTILAQIGSSLNYSVDVNTNSFGVGPFIFTVSASKLNFQPASQQIELVILAVSTSIQFLLNGTSTSTMTLYYGQKINLTFEYEDTHNALDITSPSVSIVLTGGHIPITGGNFTNVGTDWFALISTVKIGVPGTYSMTLTAGITNYQTAIATFVVSISPIPSSLNAYNASGKPQSSYTIYWGKTFKMGLLYTTVISSSNITGASIVVATALMYAPVPTGISWYNFTFNSSNIVPSVYQISLSASLANYTSSTSLITVNVLPIPTSLIAYNGTVQATSFVQLFGQNVTVKLQLKDTVNAGQSISGASWAHGYGVIIPVPSEPGNYTLRVNTTSWTSIGIAQFTVTGLKANYASSSVVITINVLAIPTTVKVYINGRDRTSTLQETINFLDNFSITANYHNSYSGTPITGALLSLGFTNATGYQNYILPASGGLGNYSMIFDSGKLGAVLGNQYIFSFSANKSNYVSLFARINIFYNPIPTALNMTYNGTKLARSGIKNSISVVYCDRVILVVNLTSFLQGKNFTSMDSAVDISAIVNQKTIQGMYSLVQHSFIISIDVNNTIYGMTAGFTHQVLVTGDASGYKGDAFNILVNVLPIPTNMSVFINTTYYTSFMSKTVFLKNTLVFTVYYERFYHGYEALSQLGATATMSFQNDTTLTQISAPMSIILLQSYFYLIFVPDLNTFNSGLKDFYITASMPNYETQQLKFSLNLNKVNTTMSVLVNGLTQSQLDHVTLGNTISFSVAYRETDTAMPVQGSTVEIQYVNDTNGKIVTNALAFNSGSGTYALSGSGLVLDLKTFIAQLKIFTITAQHDNYEVRTSSFIVSIQRIPVSTKLNATGNVTGGLTITVQAGQTINFRIDLFNTLTNLSFVDISHINVSVTPEFTGQEIMMIPEIKNGQFTGVFYTTLTAPMNAKGYTLVVKVNVTNPVLLQQYQFQTFAMFTVVVFIPPGPNLLPYIIALFIGILVITSWFVLYHVRFKYPVMIRKIMDLRRAVARGRDSSNINRPKVMSREENILDHYAKMINVYSFLQFRLSRNLSRARKNTRKIDEKIETEWGITARENLERNILSTELVGNSTQNVDGKIDVVKGSNEFDGLAGFISKKKMSAKMEPKETSEQKGETHESLYQQLVLLEQKRFKADRNIQGLETKHNKGILDDDEFKSYMNINIAGLEKIKNEITAIRRKLISA
ncbi:MAG TPA: hypothetical protein VKM55_00750 [Candidatus Lokiarchaeia archaeon]|nr:hypothetical protein [Candidatus Lokiarchaeia archaeon]